MAAIVGERVKAGDAIVDYEDKVFPDHQAEPGQKAFVFYHCVPFESSASLVNLLTATRILRKGFETHFVMFGPGSLAAAATRGFPKVGDEGFPGQHELQQPPAAGSWTRAVTHTPAGSRQPPSTACAKST